MAIIPENGHGDDAGVRDGANGGPAHDFNNLLTVIVGNAEFLSDELAAHPKLQRLARDIASAGEKSRALVQALVENGMTRANVATRDEIVRTLKT
jgi:hypothetical protein